MVKLNVILVCCILIWSAAVQAGTYKFMPYPSADLQDLPHAYYYTWGIQWTKPANEVITSATLTYKSIWDWKVEEDHLYTHLLDTVVDPNGPRTSPNWVQISESGYQYKTITIRGNDDQGGGDNFSGQGYLLGVWSDPKGGSNGKYAIDLSYSIPSAYFGWIADGNWGFGIDPDCHYYNCGIEFVVVTSPEQNPPIPEWNTVMLALVGLSSLSGIRMVRKS